MEPLQVPVLLFVCHRGQAFIGWGVHAECSISDENGNIARTFLFKLVHKTMIIQLTKTKHPDRVCWSRRETMWEKELDNKASRTHSMLATHQRDNSQFFAFRWKAQCTNFTVNPLLSQILRTQDLLPIAYICHLLHYWSIVGTKYTRRDTNGPKCDLQLKQVRKVPGTLAFCLHANKSCVETQNGPEYLPVTLSCRVDTNVCGRQKV